MSYGKLYPDSFRVGEKEGWPWVVIIVFGEGMGVIVDGHAAGEHAKKQIELSRNRTYIENLEGLCPIH